MADDGYTTIERTTTIAEGEMLVELLRQEGIAARFHRVNAPRIGVPQQVFDLRIDVPVADETRARELLADLAYIGASQSETEAAEAPSPPSAIPRRPKLAAGIAFLWPGGGHFHARRPWTGIVLGFAIVAGYVAGISSIVRERSGFAVELVFGTLVALVLADAIGGARAARAENRGVSASTARQLVRAGALLAIAGGTGAVFAATAAAPRWLFARKLSGFELRCTASALIVANGDRDARVLQVSALSLEVRTADGTPERFPFPAESVPPLSLAQGESGKIDLPSPDQLREDCRPLRCQLVFDLEARDGARPRHGPLLAQGRCRPSWDDPGTAVTAQVEPAQPE